MNRSVVGTGDDPVSLIIFDCDGVLVDSERISNEVLAAVLCDHDVQLSWREAQSMFVGQSIGQISANVAERFGVELPNDWAHAYFDRMIPALAERVVAIDGAVDVVTAVKAAGLKCCVASQGPMDKIRATLTRVGLWEAFGEAVYSAYDVTRPKPAPDLFLFASESMKVSPGQCVVIEDSVTGVAAAVGAAMRVLAYCPHGGEDNMRQRGAIPFRSMFEIPSLLGIR